MDLDDWLQLLNHLAADTRSGRVIWYPAEEAPRCPLAPRRLFGQGAACLAGDDTLSVFDLQVGPGGDPHVQLHIVQDRSGRHRISAQAETRTPPQSYRAIQVNQHLRRLASAVEESRSGAVDTSAAPRDEGPRLTVVHALSAVTHAFRRGLATRVDRSAEGRPDTAPDAGCVIGTLTTMCQDETLHALLAGFTHPALNPTVVLRPHDLELEDQGPGVVITIKFSQYDWVVSLERHPSDNHWRVVFEPSFAESILSPPALSRLVTDIDMVHALCTHLADWEPTA
jgi:hypothetical protein